MVHQTTPIPLPRLRPDDNCDSSSKNGWGTIDVQKQILREGVEVTGTPFTLNYASDRVPGRKDAYRVKVLVSGDSIPASLLNIELRITIAGQQYSQQFEPAPNLTHEFIWDGKDAYGRVLYRPQYAKVQLGYTYGAIYMEPSLVRESFGRFSGLPIVNNPAREDITIWQEWTEAVGVWDVRSRGLGGWDLNVHHQYDPVSQTLLLGDGTHIISDALGQNRINTIAGAGSIIGEEAEGAPAIEVEINPSRITVDSDGNIYLAEGIKIRRISANGVITTIAGNGEWGYGGDNGPAVDAMFDGISSITVGPNGDLFIADLNNYRIRRIDADGIITTYAGNGKPGLNELNVPTPHGDDGPALEAEFGYLGDIEFGPDGNLYVADWGVIRRIDANGTITTIAGGGEYLENSGDGGPAIEVYLGGMINDIAIGRDGAIYVCETLSERVRRIGPDGIINTIAGGGEQEISEGSYGLAVDADLVGVLQISLSAEGELYIAELTGLRVWKVNPDGNIVPFAGAEINLDEILQDEIPSHDGESALQANLMPRDIAVGPGGEIYIYDALLNRVRKVSSLLPGFNMNGYTIPSQDANFLYQFDKNGQHLRTLDALTYTTVYEFAYNEDDVLQSVTNISGEVTSIERDSVGNPTAIVAPGGYRNALQLNLNGFLTSIANQANESKQFDYEDDGLLRKVTTPTGHAYSFTCDEMGRLTNAADPAGGFSQIEQNAVLTMEGDIQEYKLTTALDNTTTYRLEQFPNGEKRFINTFPNGTRSEMRTNPDNTRTVSLPNGMVKSYQFTSDPRFGQMASIIKSASIAAPSGLTTEASLHRTAEYSDPNDIRTLTYLTDVFEINGAKYVSQYDAENQILSTTSPEERKSAITFNELGFPIESQFGDRFPTTYTYDDKGELTSYTIGAGDGERTFTLEYDETGKLVSITNPLGQEAQFEYDAADRIEKQTFADGQEIGYTYNEDGSLTSITPPGRPAHTINYTSRNQFASYTPPAVDGVVNSSELIYDSDRRIIRAQRLDGSLIDADYNANGQLATLTTPDGKWTYTYDRTTGDISTITAPNGVVLSYQKDGSLPTETRWSGPIQGSVNRTFDRDFRIASTAVNGEDAIGFEYDLDGLLVQAGSLQIKRDPANGSVTETALGEVSDAIEYNGFGEITDYSALANGQEAYSVQYTRDKLGRVVTKIETVNGDTNTFDYQYDLRGRLEEVKENGATAAVYTYDANGNRLTYAGAEGTMTGVYDDRDRLLQYGSKSYDYNENGELIRKTEAGQVIEYQHNALGGLETITLPDGSVIAYVLDGRGRRIGKKIDGALVQGFIYENILSPAAELDSNNQIVSRFVYATKGKTPDYMIKGDSVYRIITDQLGSPRLVIDAETGEIAQRLEYDEFGQVLEDTNPGFQPFGFAGGLYDADTGLTHFGLRDYDSETGRWISADPLLFGNGQTNLYSYVMNDPVNYIDPTGLDCSPAPNSSDSNNGRDWSRIGKGALKVAGGGMSVFAGIVALGAGPPGWVIGGYMIASGTLSAVSGDVDIGQELLFPDTQDINVPGGAAEGAGWLVDRGVDYSNSNGSSNGSSGGGSKKWQNWGSRADFALSFANAPGKFSKAFDIASKIVGKTGQVVGGYDVINNLPNMPDFGSSLGGGVSGVGMGGYYPGGPPCQ